MKRAQKSWRFFGLAVYGSHRVNTSIASRGEKKNPTG